MDRPLVGEIRIVGFSAIPDGWAACDGQILSIKEHPDLYVVLGSRYGGNGRTTFALPDLRGRVGIQADEESYPLGSSGGETAHALTLDELPAHHHRLAASASPAAERNGSHPRPAAVSGLAYGPARNLVPLDDSKRITRRATSHENMQPYLGLQFMIALDGRKPPES